MFQTFTLLKLTALFPSTFLPPSSEPPQNTDYSLFGVSNHYGTIDGGHYTAFCSSGPNTWHKYDDHEVYDMNARDAKTSAAYVLFYQSSNFGIRGA